MMVSTTLRDGGVPLVDVLVVAGFCASKSEARRMIRQGAVDMDGPEHPGILRRVTDERALFPLAWPAVSVRVTTAIPTAATFTVTGTTSGTTSHVTLGVHEADHGAS